MASPTTSESESPTSSSDGTVRYFDTRTTLPIRTGEPVKRPSPVTSPVRTSTLHRSSQSVEYSSSFRSSIRLVPASSSPNPEGQSGSIQHPVEFTTPTRNGDPVKRLSPVRCLGGVIASPDPFYPPRVSIPPQSQSNREVPTRSRIPQPRRAGGSYAAHMGRLEQACKVKAKSQQPKLRTPDLEDVNSDISVSAISEHSNEVEETAPENVSFRPLIEYPFDANTSKKMHEDPLSAYEPVFANIDQLPVKEANQVRKLQTKHVVKAIGLEGILKTVSVNIKYEEITSWKTGRDDAMPKAFNKWKAKAEYRLQRMGWAREALDEIVSSRYTWSPEFFKQRMASWRETWCHKETEEEEKGGIKGTGLSDEEYDWLLF
ncbi:hypothetical protein EJ08DRAFT_698694 [Tothia fuscella]|uniref:Uncharacterized protein n=1 Tax=Tothia fuscella TaxID=1048955 RepID=A0A9P4NP63_9PEZI|nr:hypothetical protein EJ08DRAFT_698694 [Tothia fuscella]